MNTNYDRRRDSENAEPNRRISLLSAILTGRRSRGIACLVLAVLIALSAAVSVTASIAASHKAASGPETKTGSAAPQPSEADSAGAVQESAPDSQAENSSDTSDVQDTEADSERAEDTEKDEETKQEEDTDEVGADDTASDETEKASDESAAVDAGEGKYTVKLNFYNKESIVRKTNAATVGDFLKEAGIELTSAQLENVNTEAKITSDLSIGVDALSYGTEDVEETVPYETEYRDTDTLDEGVTQVSVQGVEGKQTRQYTITYVNGQEVAREQTGSWVDTYAQNEIILRGTGRAAAETDAQSGADTTGGDPALVNNTATSGTFVGADGVERSYSAVLDVRATCYYVGGITASGLEATEGVIAVDPTVIPLGTRVYVVGPYGDFGERIAADTGGDIKGYTIDVCIDPNNPYAYNFGWRDMKVYILN